MDVLPSQSDRYIPARDVNFPEGKNDKKSKLSQTEKRDRLIELDNTIDQKNDELTGLINEYDKDLSNKQNQNKLSLALQGSEDYRSSLLDKFKIESNEVISEN